MPFDSLPKTTRNVAAMPAGRRWSVAPKGTEPKPRGIELMDDNFALYIVGQYLKFAWAKQLNGDDNTHCIVGWVVHFCEPLTIIQYNEQTMRLLKRLHDALPKSAQRPRLHPANVLAHYNDTHEQKDVVRVADRAYRSYIKEKWAGLDA